MASNAYNLATLNNDFAWRFYREMSGREGNLFVCPLGLFILLCLVHSGARGETATETGRVLGLASTWDPALAAAVTDFFAQLEAAVGENCTLAIADGVWLDRVAEFSPDFLELATTAFRAGIDRVDFARDPEGAANTINAWCDEQTRGKITQVVIPDMLGSLTRCVLANAVYMKGSWTAPFLPAATRDAPFHRPGLADVTVDMMLNRDQYSYAEEPGLQLLEMDYADSRLGMLVVLPGDLDGVATLERQLTPGLINGWRARMEKRDVVVHLPRFKLEAGYELSLVLGRLGIRQAFTNRADLAGMSDEPGLHLDAVVQRTYVDVNEEGTEAAAITLALCAGLAEPEEIPPPPPVFRADHPFLFLILERETGTALFIGRVMNPPPTEGP